MTRRSGARNPAPELCRQPGVGRTRLLDLAKLLHRRSMSLNRRRFCFIAAGTLVSLPFGAGCDALTFPASAAAARLKARPKPGSKTTATGRSTLNLGGARDGILQMPATIPAGRLPLLVLFHGAGGSGERQLQRFGSIPDETGVPVLALDSRGPTWDAIRGGFGPDIEFIDRALDKVFGQVAIDPTEVVAGGFSDGATYALSLGLANGDLFQRIVAWSPGFIVDDRPQGKPRIFISHGTKDEILPIDSCSRVLVPALRKRGYDVTYKEFDGPHTVPAELATEGFKFAKA